MNSETNDIKCRITCPNCKNDVYGDMYIDFNVKKMDYGNRGGVEIIDVYFYEEELECEHCGCIINTC